jgi:hypothetical protein
MAGLDVSSVAHPTRHKLLQHLAISIKFSSYIQLDLPKGGEWNHDLSNEDQTADWGIIDSIGSFRDYIALKTLEISLPVLLGWYVNRARPLAEVLPSSLEELCFRADLSHWPLFKWGVQAVKDLIEAYAMSGNRGRLRVLKYTLLAEDIDDNEDVLSDLRGICTGIGTCFEVLRLDSPDEEY